MIVIWKQASQKCSFDLWHWPCSLARHFFSLVWRCWQGTFLNSYIIKKCFNSAASTEWYLLLNVNCHLFLWRTFTKFINCSSIPGYFRLVYHVLLIGEVEPFPHKYSYTSLVLQFIHINLLFSGFILTTTLLHLACTSLSSFLV